MTIFINKIFSFRFEIILYQSFQSEYTFINLDVDNQRYSQQTTDPFTYKIALKTEYQQQIISKYTVNTQ